MEDELELDWGNEDDEHQELLRRGSASELDSKRASGDLDDPEDSVSLGDEEEQEYYATQDANRNTVSSKDISAKSNLLPKLVTTQEPPASRDSKREGSESPQKLSPVTNSPKRHQRHNSQQSPNRSHSLTSNTPARLTHALPAKPVVASVPYVPPSHPSIVEATVMSRIAGRDAKKANGNGAPASAAKPAPVSTTDLEAPLPVCWEVRQPRSGQGIYYYNVETHECQWDRPSSQSAQSQPTPEFDMLPSQPAASTNTILSYEDRHYRPVSDSAALTPVTSMDGRRNDRNINDDRYHIQPPSTLVPSVSPRSNKEPPRSRSPMADSGFSNQRGRERDSRSSRGTQRSTRGRHLITDTDSPPQRDYEVRPTDADFTERHWAQAPSVPSGEFISDTDRGSRRPHKQNQPVNNLGFEMSTEEHRARPLARSNSSRVSARDREEPRSQEHREQVHQVQSIPTSRHRSPNQQNREREPLRETPGVREDSLEQAPPQNTTTFQQPPARRDRPSRFDRPGPPPPLAPPPAQAAPLLSSKPAQEVINFRSRDQHMDNYDYPEDRDRDGRGPHDVQAELTRPLSQAATDQAGYERGRVDVPEYERDRLVPPFEYDRPSPSSDQSRRKRAPLPPQAARYRASNPHPQHEYDSYAPSNDPIHYPQSRDPPRPVNASDVNSVPLGPRQPHYPPVPKRIDLDVPRHGRMPPVLTVEFDREGRPSRSDDLMDIDRENLPSSSSRYPPSPHHDAAIRPGLTMYADRESSNTTDAPRAPRAMAKPPHISPVQKVPPPVVPYSNGPTRGRERSPPPHFAVKESRRDFDHRGDSVYEHPHPRDRGPPRRDQRNRGGDFAGPAGPLSGTNSVPIGQRRMGADGGSHPSSAFSSHSADRNQHLATTLSSVRPADDQDNVRQKMFDLPPGKESYERPAPLSNSSEPYRYSQYDDREVTSHRGPPNTLQQSANTVPLNDATRARRSRFSDNHPRFDRTPQNTRAPPRTWIQRDSSPSGRNFIADNHAVATPPPISRDPISQDPSNGPGWETLERGRSRYPSDERHVEPHPESLRGNLIDGDLLPLHASASFSSVTSRSTLHEGDVERYDDRFVDDPRHIRDPPPPHNAYPIDARRDSHRLPESFPEDRRSRWGGDVGKLEQTAYPPSNGHPERGHIAETSSLPARPETDTRRPPRRRLPPMSEPPADQYPTSEASFPREHGEERYDLSDRIERPLLGRRGGSLLDRLSLNEQDGNDAPPQQSLRDRVQVPSKRDRDDMIDQDLPFEGEDHFDMGKRRKRSGKPKRGGKRGGLA